MMRLTDAEQRVLELLGYGMSNKEIARERKVSTATVRTQLSTCFRKAEVSSRGEFTFRFFGSIAPRDDVS